MDGLSEAGSLAVLEVGWAAGPSQNLLHLSSVVAAAAVVVVVFVVDEGEVVASVAATGAVSGVAEAALEAASEVATKDTEGVAEVGSVVDIGMFAFLALRELDYLSSSIVDAVAASATKAVGSTTIHLLVVDTEVHLMAQDLVGMGRLAVGMAAQVDLAGPVDPVDLEDLEDMGRPVEDTEAAEVGISNEKALVGMTTATRNDPGTSMIISAHLSDRMVGMKGDFYSSCARLLVLRTA